MAIAQIVSSKISAEEIKIFSPKALIFSGSPDSVYENGAQDFDHDILNLDIPKLGICYGFQCATYYPEKKNWGIQFCIAQKFQQISERVQNEVKDKTILLLITVMEQEVKKLDLPSDYLLAQGTLYTDLIESGKGAGDVAQTIKSSIIM